MQRWSRVTSRVALGIAIALILAPVLTVRPAGALTLLILVTTTADELNDDGDCSLREAIASANSDSSVDNCAAGSGVDTIKVPTGTYLLNNPGLSTLEITRSVNITGDGIGKTIIDGNDRSFVAVFINKTSTDPIVSITGFTIRNAGEGGIFVDEDASLNLIRSEVRDNDATSNGAGIATNGYLHLISSIVKDNTVLARGGGIAGGSTSTIKVDRSTISGNVANQGGGINTSGNLYVTDGTVSGNQAEFSGGGILVGDGGLAYLANATITLNVANKENRGDDRPNRAGGGLRNTGTGTVYIWNTILAGNIENNPEGTTKPDCWGDLNSSGGYNLVGSNAGCTLGGGGFGNQIGTAGSPINPRLNGLADNGGPMPTHALQSNSPAVNKGNPSAPDSVIYSCRELDQRGTPRPAPPADCDIGAYEFGTKATVTSISPNSSLTLDPGFIMTVTGTGFISGTVALWNGSVRPTTVVSTTTLSVTVPATDLLVGGTPQVRARFGLSGDSLSNGIPFTVNRRDQAISFTPIDSLRVGLPAAAVSASATSALVVTVASTTPAICTYAAGTLTALTPGTCILAATQAGNGAYNPAPAAHLNVTTLPESKVVYIGVGFVNQPG